MINNVGIEKFQTLNSFGNSVNNIRKVPEQTDPIIAPSVDTQIEDSFTLNEKKVNDFKSRLKDKNWEKKFNPEFQTVRVKQKKVADGLEYSISADGTVTETGLRVQPSVILVEDKDALELYNKKANPKTLKDRVADVWKFISHTGKMVGATVKGLVYGAGAGIALLGGSWLFNSLPKAFDKEGPSLWKTISQPLKHISKSGKIIAGIGSALVLAYNLIAGKLGANQRTAVIDHKMHSGHRDK